MKQGGDTNTIAVVNGVRDRSSTICSTFRRSLKPDVVFDQSLFVKRAIETLLRRRRHRARADGHSWCSCSSEASAPPLACSWRFRCRCWPRSSCSTSVAASINTMMLARVCAGVLAADRQRRHRPREHLPPSRDRRTARRLPREKGGEEVSMAVLAATLTSSVVFFPVIFLYGVSRFLFSALALAVVLALVRLLFRRDDGCPAVLLALHEGARPHPPPSAAPGGGLRIGGGDRRRRRRR